MNTVVKNKMQDGRAKAKGYLFFLLSKWYVFVVFMALSISTVWTYLYYSDSVYRVSTKVLVRDKNNQKFGAENIIEGLEIFSTKKNIENEIEILKKTRMDTKDRYCWRIYRTWCICIRP